MLLRTEILEDVRGRRSAQTALYLHGPIEWPQDLTSAWLSENRSRLVDVDQAPPVPGAASRKLAVLLVLAPDDLSEERFADALSTLREELSRSPGAWIGHGSILGCYTRDKHVASEQDEDAILNELLEAAKVRVQRRRLWTPLRVLRLELMDFRGVDQLTLALSPNQTTVLVGVNGSGKTTLLDAAVLLLSHLEAGIRRAHRPRAFTDADIMNGRGTAKIALTAELGGNPVTWSLAHERAGEPLPAEERTGLFSLDEEITRIRGELERGDICLPVAVYYPVNRGVLDVPLRIRTQLNLFEPLEAYDGALVGDRRNFRLFFEWFRNREDLENERRIQDAQHRDHQLEAVRRAIASLMPEVSGLRVQRSPLGMVVQKGEWTLYVDQLSDGEKCLLAMVGDLARRLAMANPFADDPLQGGGVVIIDEIDLHLHPGWQRRVVPALERTFPNCQFIVTTHSPAILGHVDHASVIILKPEATGIRAARPDISKGMDVNRILEDLLDVPARPVEFEKKIADLYRRIDAGDTESARALHAELAETLGSDEPALVKAEVLLRRRETARR